MTHQKPPSVTRSYHQNTRCFPWLNLTILGLIPGALFGVVELGNRGAIALDVKSGVEYTSNINLNSSEQHDSLFYIRPLLHYRFDQGAVRVEAYGGVEVVRYDRFGINDSEDIKSNFVVDFPYGDYDEKKRYDVRLKGGYNEHTSADSSVQSITQTEEVDLSVIGRYYVSDRFFVRGGADYLDRESKTTGFNDVRRYRLPVEFFYEYSEDLNYGVGYRYTDTDVNGTAPEADSEVHAVFVGAEGRILPSVLVEVRVGAQEREFDSPAYSDDTAVFAESVFTWEASEQTHFLLAVGNEFGTTIGNQSSETFYVEGTVEHRLNEKIRSAASIRYEDVDYTVLSGGVDRMDEEWSARFGTIYTLIEDRLELEGRLSYADRDSSRATSNYDVFIANLSVSFLF